jgi:hypothetical protein
MHKCVLRLGVLIGIVFTVAGLLIAVIEGSLAAFIVSDPLYVYILLLCALCVGIALLNQYISARVVPSTILFLCFALFAIFGPVGAQMYQKIYGMYHGQYTIESTYPLLVFEAGTACCFLGILMSRLILSVSKCKSIVNWDLMRITSILWLILGVACVSSVYALYTIGYVPLFRSGIDIDRASYSRVVGEYPLKLSTLWLVAGIISSMLMNIKNNKILYAGITAICLFGLSIYGQRNYMFVTLCSAVLLRLKFKRINACYYVFGALLILGLILYGEIRAGRWTEKVTLSESIIMNVAKEWREYSIVVNDVKASGHYYGGNIFIGAIVPIFPKQVWAAFGIDKEYVVRHYYAGHVFGEQFGDPIGIRIGTIGEAYAGYGLIYGVGLQMLVFGLLFGWLESAYIRLHKTDARLSVVCFLLSLLLSLPVTTLYVTMSYGTFFGWVFITIGLIGTTRRRMTVVGAT